MCQLHLVNCSVAPHISNWSFCENIDACYRPIVINSPNWQNRSLSANAMYDNLNTNSAIAVVKVLRRVWHISTNVILPEIKVIKHMIITDLWRNWTMIFYRNPSTFQLFRISLEIATKITSLQCSRFNFFCVYSGPDLRVICDVVPKRRYPFRERIFTYLYRRSFVLCSRSSEVILDTRAPLDLWSLSNDK